MLRTTFGRIFSAMNLPKVSLTTTITHPTPLPKVGTMKVRRGNIHQSTGRSEGGGRASSEHCSAVEV